MRGPEHPRHFVGDSLVPLPENRGLAVTSTLIGSSLG